LLDKIPLSGKIVLDLLTAVSIMRLLPEETSSGNRRTGKVIAGFPFMR
jgi:hypothetical protein